MSTYTKLHYHIVFATHKRVPCLHREWRDGLWKYMGGTINGLGAQPRGIGGWIDHAHLLLDLKPTDVLSDIVREVKKASTQWVRTHAGLGQFKWQEGYGAFTVGWREHEAVRAYIADQEEHHRTRSFREELEKMLIESGVEFNPIYLP